jgi:hypothetical protein
VPIAYMFSRPREITLIARGEVTFADIAVILDELLDDPSIVPGTQMLVDARQVTDVPSTPELRLVARDMAPLHQRGVVRMAVCAEGAFVYGVARMFGVFAEAIGLHVAAFRNMREARDWLSDGIAA